MQIASRFAAASPGTREKQATMIQRIQSVYLLLGSAACALPFGFGFAALEPAAPAWVGTVRTALVALAAVVGFVSIFLFTNRSRQQSVVFLAQMLALLCFIIVVATLLLYGSNGTGVQALVGDSDSVVTSAAPLVGGLLYVAARRGIARDIKLVKSMDRLRD